MTVHEANEAGSAPSGCVYCGTPAPAGAGERVMGGWSTQVESRGRAATLVFLCPTCTRTHTRDIEAKLDEQFWA